MLLEGWYRDGALEEIELGDEVVQVTTVGWLEPAHPHAVGPSTRVVQDKLALLVGSASAARADPFGRALTTRVCPFCGDASLGRDNVWVPDPESARLFYTPARVAHYVREHRYRPPQAFAEAVMRCPPMDSVEYWTRFARSTWGRLRRLALSRAGATNIRRSVRRETTPGVTSMLEVGWIFP